MNADYLVSIVRDDLEGRVRHIEERIILSENKLHVLNSTVRNMENSKSALNLRKKTYYEIFCQQLQNRKEHKISPKCRSLVGTVRAKPTVKKKCDFFINASRLFMGDKLQIELVCGIEAQHSDLFLNSSQELIYNVGKCAVLVDPESLSQRIYADHQSRIEKMCLHPNYTTCATAEVNQERVYVRVWSTQTMETKKVIRFDESTKRLTCMCFSSAITNGKYLVVVMEDIGSFVSVFQWKAGRRVAETKLDWSAKGFNIIYSPRVENVFVVWKSSRMWVLSIEGRELHKIAIGKTSLKIPQTFITCVIFFSNGNLISGHSDGSVKVWKIESKRLLCTLEGHKSSITAMAQVTEAVLVTACRSKAIRFWLLAKQTCTTTIKLDSGNVLRFCNDVYKLYLLTSRNIIFEVKNSQTFPVLQSHQSKITDVAVSQRQHFVVSGDSSGILVKRDLLANGVMGSIQLDSPITCVSFSFDGEKIFVGTSDGECLLLESLNLTECAGFSDGFGSPRLCCFGAKDNKLAVYYDSGTVCVHQYNQIDNKYQRTANFLVNCPIEHIEWSWDGRNLAATSHLISNTIYSWNSLTAAQLTFEEFCSSQWMDNYSSRFSSVYDIYRTADSTKYFPSTFALAQHSNRVAVADMNGKLNILNFGDERPDISKQPSAAGKFKKILFCANDTRIVCLEENSPYFYQYRLIREHN